MIWLICVKKVFLGLIVSTISSASWTLRWEGWDSYLKAFITSESKFLSFCNSNSEIVFTSVKYAKLPILKPKTGIPKWSDSTGVTFKSNSWKSFSLDIRLTSKSGAPGYFCLGSKM